MLVASWNVNGPAPENGVAEGGFAKAGGFGNEAFAIYCAGAYSAKNKDAVFGDGMKSGAQCSVGTRYYGCVCV
jgi:hypothetical protein